MATESLQTSMTPNGKHQTEIITNVVNSRNLNHFLPQILTAIDAADFVAVDTEFTGLCMSPDRRSPNIAARYDSLREHVSQYALLQIGLSCFKSHPVSKDYDASSTCSSPIKTSRISIPQPECSNNLEQGYHTTTYTLNLMRQEDFIVSPSSLSFLASSGINFDSIFRDGIPFHFCFERNKKKCLHCSQVEAISSSSQSQCCNKEILSIFEHIRSSGKALVLHNGLMDLLFIYSSFFG